MSRRAFTLIELLVVIAIIALLIGIAIPVLGAAREQARSVSCGVNLNQLGVAITMHLGDHKDRLPQVRVDFAGNLYDAPGGDNIGSLFGGKKGQLPIYGINTLGADRRPLNAYLGDFGPDDEVEVFRDPSDQGTSDPSLAYLEQAFGTSFDKSSMYELIGTSYNLNDHALDADPGSDELYPTLIPEEGGRMPDVRTPSKTWLLGDQPIYNYDKNGDRGQRWHKDKVIANLLFVDMHVDIGRPVPQGVENTTPDYTFLPTPDWLDRFTPSP